MNNTAKIKLKLRKKFLEKLDEGGSSSTSSSASTPTSATIATSITKHAESLKLQSYPTLAKQNYNLINLKCQEIGLCINMQCQRCFERSFASKQRSGQWSSENKLSPRQVTRSSGLKYWFNCDHCPHTYKTALNLIEASKKNRGCPYCANQALCLDSKCLLCQQQSFASSEKAKYWSKLNGSLTPRDVFRSATTIVWIDCVRCHHVFQSTTNAISRGRWCPYCALKELCGDPQCQTCHRQSFASHPRSQYWSLCNQISPEKVFRTSNNKYWFDCDQCHQTFETDPNTIVCLQSWCPFCVNKTELKLYNWLILNVKDSITQRVKYTWCKSDNGAYRPFDFAIESLKLLIELDGEQHFSQVSNWQNPKET